MSPVPDPSSYQTKNMVEASESLEPNAQESGGAGSGEDPEVETLESEVNVPTGPSNDTSKEVPEVSAPEVDPIEVDVGEWIQGMTMEHWAEQQQKDIVLSRLRDLLMQNPDQKPKSEFLKNEAQLVQSYCKHWGNLVVEDEVVKRKHFPAVDSEMELRQILVPDKLKLQLFMRIHGYEAGHTSYDRVYDLMQSRFWWCGMSTDVMEWLKACDTCQRNKPGRGKGRYPLNQELAYRPLDRVAVDIMGPWKTSTEGNQYILVLQDYFTKWVEIWPLPNHKASTVAKTLVRYFFSKYGPPVRLHSDQGREFESQLFQELCSMWSIVKTRTTPYAPWSDGMVERVNRIIQAMIKHHVQRTNQLDWDQWLWAVAFTYNTTVHASTNCTPAKLFLTQCADLRLPLDLVYGTKPPGPKGLDGCPMGYIEQLKVSIPKLYQYAGAQLQQNAKVQSNAFAKAGYRIRQYLPGQLVWRYYPPWANEKLSSAWTGPWEVLFQYPNATVKIQLARGGVGAREKAIIVVHASCLKPVCTTGDGKLLQCDTYSVLHCPPQIEPGKTQREPNKTECPAKPLEEGQALTASA